VVELADDRQACADRVIQWSVKLDGFDGACSH
jgi:hypothetical protein